MSADRLLLPADVRETLHERRVAGAPAEVCGVLLGDRAGDADGDDAAATDRGSDEAAHTDRGDDDGGGDRTAGDDAPADRVAEAVAVANVAADADRRYELDPAETVAVVDDAESRGRDVVGFYHSHPRGPAEPSATDRDRATWTGYVYAIVAPEDVAAFRWTGESFRPLRVETP
ncbi:M67 family metallopeptidase [Halobaculum sp. CBA1158]|uniref:desampylase n=1 Tax=Halobaculum sp. CBA1158 TaxID=2904243 RepID=UPI001F2AD672|nr:desampylase [Halobaculum sp. CBA1158]UIO99505.1 M67 family metallopeptidase [Halobaculum sp. CBA1158]